MHLVHATVAPGTGGQKPPASLAPSLAPLVGSIMPCRPRWREGPLEQSERTRAKTGPTTTFVPIFGASPRRHTVEPLGLE